MSKSCQSIRIEWDHICWSNNNHLEMNLNMTYEDLSIWSRTLSAESNQMNSESRFSSLQGSSPSDHSKVLNPEVLQLLDAEMRQNNIQWWNNGSKRIEKGKEYFRSTFDKNGLWQQRAMTTTFDNDIKSDDFVIIKLCLWKNWWLCDHEIMFMKILPLGKNERL